jgi:predicted ribosome quality control (RQC) complex YloA/Tae2 family protein
MFENRRTLQSTLLLQKKKEMNAVQAALEKKRLEFAKRMEECREKQEELRAKVSYWMAYQA